MKCSLPFWPDLGQKGGPSTQRAFGRLLARSVTAYARNNSVRHRCGAAPTRATSFPAGDVRFGQFYPFLPLRICLQVGESALQPLYLAIFGWGLKLRSDEAMNWHFRTPESFLANFRRLQRKRRSSNKYFRFDDRNFPPSARKRQDQSITKEIITLGSHKVVNWVLFFSSITPIQEQSDSKNDVYNGNKVFSSLHN